MKVLTLIKAKSNVFLWYVQCWSCTQRSKTKISTTRAPPSWIEFDVVTSHCQMRHLEYGLWLLISTFLFWEFQVVLHSRKHFEFDIVHHNVTLKTLYTFTLIKVTTLICKMEISGIISPSTISHPEALTWLVKSSGVE